MCPDSLQTQILAHPQHLSSLLGLARGAAGFPVAPPVTVYVEPFADLGIADSRASSSLPATLPRRRTIWKRTHPCRRARSSKSFTARARRQRRHEIAEFEALPIVCRARAAGLHGAALRAYVSAVERLDGPSALTE
jgi:hypothetical protein